MRLGFDEIKRRAKAFSEDWKDAHYEKGETHSFYNDFFKIFGVSRRAVAVYEKRVQSLDTSKRGYIDLFWPGVLIVEQKSAGRDLFAASSQASTYFDWLPERDQPRYMLVCDFQRFKLTDLDDNGREISFALSELHKYVEAFDFILGRRVTFATQAGVTVKAAELMGKLHDALEESGYTGNDLEQLLVRLLFCLFADDTGIFQPKDIFLQLIDNDTADDGHNVGRMLNELFDVLDTPEDKRQAGLSGELNAFPYVNGALFAGHVRTPVFDKKMRDLLLVAAKHDWSGVSPAIFGSLFQSVMSPKERRAKGAHYTTEANIMKVIGPLFLDDLKAELAKINARKTGRDSALKEYLAKLSRLTFFDPACGCGNFLVIAYREIRRLELAALRILYPQDIIDAALLSRVTVDQFYGIEYEEFPAKIAEVAMWMMDHIANNEINEAFRTNYARIPLKDSAHIFHGDALEVDWADLLPPEKCHYIMGNPPFVGKKTPFQTQQMARVINAPSGKAGTLDYVAAWFIKAGQYMNLASPLVGEVGGGPAASAAEMTQSSPPNAALENNAPQTRRAPTPPSPQGGGGNKRIRIAFVSTNSITQGEQVAQLWPILFDRLHLEIFFAHRTFRWASEATGKAHVDVVIIGLTHHDNEPDEKRLFSYSDIKGDPVESTHSALTAYLFDAKGVTNRHLVVRERSTPLAEVPPILYGNKPVDDGNLIFDTATKDALLAKEPDANKYIRFLVSSREYLNGGERWCLWLTDAEPNDLRRMTFVMSRIEAVRVFRAASKKIPTQKASNWPSLFAEIRQPQSGYVLVPRHSSENRHYVPFDFFGPETIVHDSCTCIPNGQIYHFGIISARMHVAWLSHVGGRIKSDFRYANTMVYNTFPWPEATAAQRAKIEALAQAVLDTRAAHQPLSSLADLYNPDTMPGNLRKAHAALDTAVDKLYRAAPFASDRDRVEHLFGRYEALVNPLERVGIAKNKRVARKTAANGK